MSKIVTTEVNERRHRVIIDRHELKRIITDAVMQQLGKAQSETITVKVEIKDVTEGSPGYRVGHECIVDVVEDLRCHEAPSDTRLTPPPSRED